jgi:hypothetical protein
MGVYISTLVLYLTQGSLPYIYIKYLSFLRMFELNKRLRAPRGGGE